MRGVRGHLVGAGARRHGARPRGATWLDHHRTASTLFPDQAQDPRFPGLLDGAISLIRGLVMAIPVFGREAVDARWETIKPILLEGAARLLDEPGD